MNTRNEQFVFALEMSIKRRSAKTWILQKTGISTMVLLAPLCYRGTCKAVELLSYVCRIEGSDRRKLLLRVLQPGRRSKQERYPMRLRALKAPGSGRLEACVERQNWAQVRFPSRHGQA